MKVTIWTLLSTAFHLVLARFYILPVVALPPFMAFPLIPILAYILVVSAFSYISARILKRFNIGFDFFGFLRRKGRLSPTFRIIPVEHELLPTSTPSRLPNSTIGVFAGSSNVSILRSSSVDILPGSSSRLISPASSPPPKTPFHPTSNRSLASFPSLWSSSCKLRRSRSLNVLISRSHDQTSRFSPSPPPQQGTLDDNTRSGDWIPLAPLSRNTPLASDFLSVRDTLAPAPVFNVSSISAPVTPRPNPDLLGPLIDISPISSSSSDRRDFPLAIMSSSSSELAPPSYSSPSESDLGSSPQLAMSFSRSSDIGAQRIGGAAGFAYDWGFEMRSRTAPHASEKQNVSAPLEVPPIFSGAIGADTNKSRIDCHEIRHLEDQDFDQDKNGQVETMFVDTSQEEHDAEPIIVNNDPLSKSSQVEVSPDIEMAMEEITYTPTFKGDFMTQIVVCDSNTENTLTEVYQDTWAGVKEPNLLPPPLADKVFIGERPSVSVDTTQPPTASKEGALLSARKSLCPSPLQTPTPPASPPMMRTTMTRSASSGQIKPLVPTEYNPEFFIEKETDKGETFQGSDVLNLPDNEEAGLDSTMADTKEDVDVEQSESAPVTSSSSETNSPSSIRPSWSARAIDAPPLVLSAACAATVEEDVSWPEAPEKTEEAREPEPEEGLKENISEEPAAQQEDLSTESVQVSHDTAQAQALTLMPSVPGSFTEESERAQTDIQVVSATSMAVTHTVVGADIRRRRRNATAGLPIDVALTMQLRPGFGVGADPAWMVRFMMTVFGWFAVMIAGRGGEVDVYAL